MIIEPIKKKNGTIFTNVELTKICYEKLLALKNGTQAKTEAERERDEDAFFRICGGSKNAEEIMAFMKQIADEPDEERAQKILARGLIPVDNIQSKKEVK